MSLSKADELIQRKGFKTPLDFLKFYLKIIKENLALIVIIPTVLGGTWQFVNLFNIGLPYVRFFSITQLISDGLIILIILFFTAFFIFYCLFLIFIIFNLVEEENRKMVDIIVLAIISTSILFLINFPFLNEHFDLGFYLTFPNNTHTNAGKLFLFIPILFLSSYCGWKVLNIIGEYLVSNRILATKLYKRIYFNVLTGFQILLGIIWMSNIILAVYVFFDLFSNTIGTPRDLVVPENLQNISNIERLVEKNYNLDSRKIKISYLNDTYIFVKHIEISNDSVKKLKDVSEPIPFNVILFKVNDLFETE